MGLHAYHEDENTLEYYCNNPKCLYHNCADWEPYRQCAHHDTREYTLIPAVEMKRRLQGILPAEQLAHLGDTIISQESRTHRVSGGSSIKLSANHPAITWTGEKEVQLPMCECGTQMTLKVVFDEDELNAPNIRILHRNAKDPSIIDSISQHPMVARHQALAKRLEAIGNVYLPLLPLEEKKQ